MRPAPLFNDNLPFMRPHIAGFERGQRVEIPDPKSKTLARRGKVSVTLPHWNEVVVMTDAGVVVTIDAARVRRVSGC